MKPYSLLLFSALLSGCASAPQQTASTCPVEAKAAPVEAKQAQETLKPAPSPGQCRPDYVAAYGVISPCPSAYTTPSSISSSICDSRTALAASTLRLREMGTPMAKAIKAIDAVDMGPQLRQDMHRMIKAIYLSSDPLHVVAEERLRCLKRYGMESL